MPYKRKVQQVNVIKINLNNLPEIEEKYGRLKDLGFENGVFTLGTVVVDENGEEEIFSGTEFDTLFEESSDE